jgi:AcrR family transcriptional regulator
MNAPSPKLEETKSRILEVALQIIHETGDFDLPMRKLAARAQVSLRTPYELFGSKSRIIGALLLRDQAAFGKIASEIKSADELENILDRLEAGILVFSRNEPFYRALFLATQAYTPAQNNDEPARENLRSFRILCTRASRAGLIRPDIDPWLIAEVLTDVFSANVRAWARSSLDLRRLELKMKFGIACVLASAAPEPAATRMRARMAEYQMAMEACPPPPPAVEAPRPTVQSAPPPSGPSQSARPQSARSV